MQSDSRSAPPMIKTCAGGKCPANPTASVPASETSSPLLMSPFTQLNSKVTGYDTPADPRQPSGTASPAEESSALKFLTEALGTLLQGQELQQATLVTQQEALCDQLRIQHEAQQRFLAQLKPQAQPAVIPQLQQPSPQLPHHSSTFTQAQPPGMAVSFMPPLGNTGAGTCIAGNWATYSSSRTHFQVGHMDQGEALYDCTGI
ncbi:hypothetical protein K439DRAFT_1618647 [Ramaria rubella]|nr:hypothetical protein K439DRAFT_1618647 [Ramaria rubella]